MVTAESLLSEISSDPPEYGSHDNMLANQMNGVASRPSTSSIRSNYFGFSTLTEHKGTNFWILQLYDYIKYNFQIYY